MSLSSLVLLPAPFSRNGLGWPGQGRRLLRGLSLKEGSCGRGSESCGVGDVRSTAVKPGAQPLPLYPAALRGGKRS